MDDEELRDAYERLTGAATPPGDARDRVATRMGQRRRRRASGYAALAVLVVVGGGGVAAQVFDGTDSARTAGADESPNVTESAGITGLPTEVTCPGGDRPLGYDLDHSGYDSLDELLTEQTRGISYYGVDPDQAVLWKIRQDGTAFGMVRYSRGGDRWFPDGGLSCEGGAGDSSPGAALDVACDPDAYGITRATATDTLTEFTAGRVYIHDRGANQLYFLGRDGTFSSTTIYSRPDQQWYPEQLAKCPRTAPTEPPQAGSPLSDLLDCDAEDIVTATIDNPEATLGWEDPRAAVSWWGSEGDYSVETADTDDGATTASIVDRDGSVRAAAEIREVDGHWQGFALAACADAVPGLPRTRTPVLLTALKVGHCWVEPVAAEGNTWLPAKRDQFGSGGMWPEDFRGVGTFTVDGDVLTYLDAGGSEVEMLRTDDARTELPGGGICA